jgi:signal transduction histidine kinase
VAQEAIENAVKHADSQALALSLTQSGETLTLVVRDDGTGFDPKAAEKTGHFGLLGMRERARLVGGTLNIASHPGQGTMVTLAMPV